MIQSNKISVRLFPFLYILWFFVVLYSVEDMATSGSTFSEGTSRSGVYIALIAIIGILGIYYLMNFKVYTLSPMIPLLFMVVWILIDNLLLGNYGGRNRWASLTHFGLVAWWFLTIIFVYNYTLNNQHKEKQIRGLTMLMFVYYCYKFIEISVASTTLKDDAIALNLIYRVVVFMPIICMLENKKLRNCLLAIIFCFALFSMKRGALIAIPAMLLANIILDRNKKINIVKTILMIIFITVFAVFAVNVANDLTGGMLAERFTWEELSTGSGRDVKYENAIIEISQRNFVAFLLGIGSATRAGVHNEILEFLYTFGFIGLCIYLSMLVSMARRLSFLYKTGSSYAGIYGMIFIFIFLVGLYSGVMFTHSTFYIMLTLGIVERRILEERTGYV